MTATDQITELSGTGFNQACNLKYYATDLPKIIKTLQTFYRFSGFLNLKTALVGISRSLCGTVYMGIIVVVVIIILIIVIIVKTSKAHTYTPEEHALKKKRETWTA